jgi:DNA replication protein DnaC
MKPLTPVGTIPTPYPLLEEQLQALQLASMRQEYATQAAVARHQGWPYEHYLAILVEQEMERRTRNRRQRRIQEARFPLLKELADFDFSALTAPSQAQVRQLADGAYLAQAQPILLVGGPGLGKTHVAIGLGLAACRQNQRVRFYTVTALVNELHQAQDHHQLPKFLDKALRHQLIILDEFGYVPFTTSGAQLLFQFCSALHERVSLLITTNLPFGEWVQVLGSERLTAGLLDRVTCTAHILEFVGESYRFRQGLAHPASPPLPETLRNSHNVGEHP